MNHHINGYCEDDRIPTAGEMHAKGLKLPWGRRKS